MFNVYTKYVQYLAIFVEYLHNTWPTFALYVCNNCTMFKQYLRNIHHIQYLHNICAIFEQYLHNLCKIFAQYLYSIRIIFAQSIYDIFKIYKQYLHNILYNIYIIFFTIFAQ